MLASMGPLTPIALMYRLAPDSKNLLPFRQPIPLLPLKHRRQRRSLVLPPSLPLPVRPSRISHRPISLPRMSPEDAMQNKGRPPLEQIPLLKRSNRIESFARYARSGSSSDKIARTVRTLGSSTEINAWLDSACHVAE